MGAGPSKPNSPLELGEQELGEPAKPAKPNSTLELGKQELGEPAKPNSPLALGEPACIRSVPSPTEVDSAISQFGSFLQSEVGSSFGELPLRSCITTRDAQGIERSLGDISFKKAYQWMAQVKPIKDMVLSAVSNPAVFGAFLNDPVVLNMLSHPETIMNSKPQTINSSHQVSKCQSNSTQLVSRLQPNNIQQVSRCQSNNTRQQTPVIHHSSGQQTPVKQHSSADVVKQHSSAEKERSKLGIWQKILLFLSRAGKMVLNMMEEFLFGADNNTADEEEEILVNKGKQHQARWKVTVNDDSKRAIAVAYMLSIVVMAGITALRIFVVHF